MGAVACVRTFSNTPSPDRHRLIVSRRGVGPGGRPEKWQAVAVRQQPAAQRPEGQVGLARQGDAERVPVQAPVEQPEPAPVDVDEEHLVLEHGQVERQPLDLGGLDAGPVGGALGPGIGRDRGRGHGHDCYLQGWYGGLAAKRPPAASVELAPAAA